jgi:hypothetical protein
LDWSGEDFSGCDLRNANLSDCKFDGADFRDANLWNADLRDSDLSGALNVLSSQLAATDLTRAKLPDSLTDFEALESVKTLSENSSKVFFTILIVVVYSFLTMATTKDVQLITNSYSSKLPVLGAELPVVGFYVVTPIILLGLFIYFHIYFQRLWETLTKLPAIFPDGRRLDEKSHPWLLNDLAARHFPRLRERALRLSALQSVLSILLGYCLVPFTLLALWMRFIRVDNWIVTGIQVAAIAIAVEIGSYNFRLIQTTVSEKDWNISIGTRLKMFIGIGYGIPAAGLALAFTYWCSRELLEWDKSVGFMYEDAAADLSLLGLLDGSGQYVSEETKNDLVAALRPKLIPTDGYYAWQKVGSKLAEVLHALHLET